MPEASVRPLFLRPWTVPAALVVALLAGGGGAEGPLQNGVIAAAGVILFFLVIAEHASGRLPPPRSIWLPALFALLLLLIPVIQLVPLPPEIWQMLPGRENAIGALREANLLSAWRPLSLDPEATKRSALALMLPIALFLHTARSSPRDNLRLIKVVVACAGVSGLIGALQLAAGHPDWLSYYNGPTRGAASGVFANPNHQSLLMVCAMAACAILIRASRERQAKSSRNSKTALLLYSGLIFFFAIMALASGSRAAVLLLALGLPGTLIVALGSGSILRWAATMIGAVASLWVVVLLYPNTNSLGIRESFRLGEDARYAYLPDILFTLDQFWPVGSGLGTFANVFSPNENLDIAQQGYLNHAHNDLLEWLIETGALGTAWLGLAAMAILYVAYKVLRDRDQDTGKAAGGILILLLIVVHSLADYSLRTATIASIAAIALGLLPASVAGQVQKSADRRRLIPLALALLLALPIAAEGLRLHIVRWAVRDGRQELAFQLGQTSGSVLALQADNSLRDGRPREAIRLASLAVSAQPMNAAAVRALAMSHEAQGRPAGQIWRVASSLGWRDAPTQLWAYWQALADNEHAVAALRADALLRTSKPPAEFLQLVRLAARDQRFALPLANRIQLDPSWRRRYFLLDDKSSQDEIEGLVATLRAMASSAEGPSRADGNSIIAQSIRRKDYDQAVAVHQLVAGNRAGEDNLIDDGGFARMVDDYAVNSTLFDWRLHKRSETSGSIDASPPTYLVTDTDGERSLPAAERYVRLPAGSYRLSYRVRSDAVDAFRVRIACVDQSAPLASDIPPGSQSFSQRTLAFTINPACRLTRIVIESLPIGTAATAEFDDFQLAVMSPAIGNHMQVRSGE